MASAQKLRSALAAAGLTLLGFSTHFNDVAAQTTAEPTAKIAKNNKNAIRTPQDKTLHDSLLAAYDAVIRETSYYARDKEGPDSKTLIATAHTALDQGANPNIVIQEDDTSYGTLEITLLMIERGLEKETGFALMRKLAAKGADKQYQDEYGITVMDRAFATFAKQSHLSVSETKEALKVIRFLYDIGMSEEDAIGHREKVVPFPGPSHYAYNKDMLNLLKEYGLIDDRHYERITTGSPQARQIVQDNNHLTHEMLKNNGATLRTMPTVKAAKKSDLPRLATPQNHANREIDLVAIESQNNNDKGAHFNIVFKTALQTAMAINPDVDTKNFHGVNETIIRQINANNSDIITALLNNNGARIADNVVFSSSEGPASTNVEDAQDLIVNRDENHPDFTTVKNTLNDLQKNNVIIFKASGNDWFNGGGRLAEGSYYNHSPRAVVVGASADFPSKNNKKPHPAMAHYSNPAADICSRVPTFDGAITHGTSTATPALAATYRQMAEWYGDALSFEEIMAAGLMSADRDIMDFKSPGVFKDDENHAFAQNPANFETESARYTSNGGGLPWHERCGAGVINPAKWNNALQKMIELKHRDGLETENTIAKFVTPSGHEEILDNKKTIKVYKFVVPEDMTLGRMTLVVPGGSFFNRTPIVHTPAGFQFRMPMSVSEIFSTYALAYEDVKRGDIITIHTAEELYEGAGIYVRGQKPGNSIAALRDHLRAAGALPEPARAMVGDAVTGAAEPISARSYPTAPPEPQLRRE
ncbi:S8/S53 family peptidase [Micavibrio aeruginosavorus]|uniref:Peptidase S8/S53 domain-containing protein n=1 Tax=Micavibrio aeruginosavorus EPB TaxID=349215 RepID=M4VCF0_9BACT|nr:hypothetical protein [Micavibrio aeruginosavorus]AGH97052.1 hypothetical protein A11S_216 [Micavibrio aeruginosavorus EPB]